MKQLYLLSFASILFIACKKEKETIVGHGDPINEDRVINNFTAIHVSGSMMVVVYKEPQPSMYVAAQKGLLPYLESKVSNGVLDIHWNDEVKINGMASAWVSVPELRSINVEGESGVVVGGDFAVPTMDVSISDGGSVQMYQGHAQNFSAFLSGTGMRRTLGHPTTLEAFGLTSKTAQITLIGNATAELTCLDQLNVKIEGVKIDGTGFVWYKGNPSVSSKISGKGEVIRTL